MSQSSTGQAPTGICNKNSVKNNGLNVWASGEHDGDPPRIDVVAVQGLGAHPYYTWVFKPEKTNPLKPYPSCHVPGQYPSAQASETLDTAKMASDASDNMWLLDLLPNLIPQARIATYSYESDWRKASVKTTLRQCGEQLLNVLLQYRSTEKKRRRPLIFIGHSIGGLVIKQALVLADHGNTFRDIRLSMAGIIFLGTPHQGSNAAGYGVWLAWAAGHDTALLESLKRDSTTLYDIASDFEKSYGPEADIVCFYEHEDASYGPLRTQIVKQQSASLLGKRKIYLQTDHSGMNKFSGPSDANFLLVWPEIDRMVKEAPLKVEKQYRLHGTGTAQIQKIKRPRDDEEAKLLETLASDYKSDKDLVSERVPGTCEWFFEDDRFLDWRDSDGSRLLWVSAGPGCGKSVLAKALIDERKVCINTKASTICYFFFKDGQEQRTHGANALSALLHQLFQNTSLATYALDSHRSHGKELRNRFSELWEILVRSVEDPQAGEIICVLDALDECEEKARCQLIDKLIQLFSTKGSYQNPRLRLKFLVTSRPYDDLEYKFQKLSDVSTYIRFDGDEKSQRIGQEINLVIDANIPHITGGFDHDQRERICNRLKEMENRTYLWLFLTIGIIEESPSNFRRKTDIDSLLSNLPSEISDAYERILSRSKDGLKARILLEIIVAATRPLSLQEANMALATATREHSCRFQKDLELWPVESFGSTVRNFCGLFVNVYDGKLFLIHQTAREFLLGTSKPGRSHLNKWEGCLDLATAHGTLSQICLSYLSFEDRASIDQGWLDEESSSILPLWYLMKYAAEHWATHYNSQPVGLAKDSQDVVVSLCNASTTQGLWFSCYCKPRSLDSKDWTALGIALQFGLIDVAEGFLSEGADANAQAKSFGSVLQIASCHGHNQIVRTLLDEGADVNAQGGPYGSALQAASGKGHVQILRMLLDKEADVEGQSGPYGSPLHAASRNGHVDIVRMLLDKGVDVNAPGEPRGMRLLWASGDLAGEVFPVHDRDDAHYLDGGSALTVASGAGYDQIVQMLLDNGATDIQGKALTRATFKGYDHVVQLLLDYQGEEAAQGKDYCEALKLALLEASKKGYDQIVRMLLDKGARIGTECAPTSDFALMVASEGGHSQIVRMLLDDGAADVFGFALRAASYEGHVQVVRMLLENRWEDYAPGIIHSEVLNHAVEDVDGKALEKASKRGFDHVAQIMFDSREEIYAQGGINSDPLDRAVKAASKKGHDQVVRILRIFNQIDPMHILWRLYRSAR